MPNLNMTIVNQILEEDSPFYVHSKRYRNRVNKPQKTNKINLTKKKSYISKPKVSYNEYILSRIKTYSDLITYVKEKHVFVVSFVYNSGMNNIKNYNNRCEFIIRVNKHDIPHTKVFLLNKFEIEQFIELLTILKNKKGDM